LHGLSISREDAGRISARVPMSPAISTKRPISHQPTHGHITVSPGASRFSRVKWAFGGRTLTILIPIMTCQLPRGSRPSLRKQYTEGGPAPHLRLAMSKATREGLYRQGHEKSSLQGCNPDRRARPFVASTWKEPF
jgi:hypothetical protein